MHNRYPTDYHCAVYDIAKRQPRPVARFNRSGWTGTAACSDIVWGGDNTTVWDYDGLSSAVKEALSMGLSGVSRWASDIGGYNTYGPMEPGASTRARERCTPASRPTAAPLASSPRAAEASDARGPAVGLGFRDPQATRNEQTLTRPRVLLAACAAGAAVAFAGCSSTESKNDYVDTVNEIQQRANEAYGLAANAATNKPGELVRALQDSEEELDAVVSELEGLDVPEDAQGGHEDLVAGFDRLRELVTRAADEAGMSEGAAVFAPVAPLASNGASVDAKIDMAIERINQDLGAD